MRFAKPAERVLLLCEVGQLDLIDEDGRAPEQIPEDVLDAFIERRNRLVYGASDFARSECIAHGSVVNNAMLMRVASRFHGRTAGKRMHKILGRHLAVRICGQDEKSLLIVRERLLNAVSSLRSLLYTGNEEYQTLSHHIEWQQVTDIAIPMLLNIEQKWLQIDSLSTKGEANLPLQEDELCILLALVHPVELGKAFNKANCTVDAVQWLQDSQHHLYNNDSKQDIVQRLREKLEFK
ncbi:hypothetical protein HUZ36_14305 [Pseudoalteromonas sp. McH1-7]|uniref:hypothetical protein n=1 Tax=Pseudoalteromonas sp. McH1-7 TaxID=2745574 RepID=UPI0015922032|nr:hypothetical protein [Pseudoalteromonas sp. McH1-7]NUZ11957.1 hypothetical protein [Pseudoalteromonas sp. McH1-7]